MTRCRLLESSSTCSQLHPLARRPHSLTQAGRRAKGHRLTLTVIPLEGTLEVSEEGALEGLRAAAASRPGIERQEARSRRATPQLGEPVTLPMALSGRFTPRRLVSHVCGADSTSSSSIEVTKLFAPTPSKLTTVRALVVAVVTPIPKIAWLTRWPSAKVGSLRDERCNGESGRNRPRCPRLVLLLPGPDDWCHWRRRCPRPALRHHSVLIAVAEEVAVVDRDQVGLCRHSGGDHPYQLLIAEVRAILHAYPVSIEGCVRNAHPELVGSIGSVDAEPILTVLVDVLELQEFDANGTALRWCRNGRSREERLI